MNAMCNSFCDISLISGVATAQDCNPRLQIGFLEIILRSYINGGGLTDAAFGSFVISVSLMDFERPQKCALNKRHRICIS